MAYPPDSGDLAAAAALAAATVSTFTVPETAYVATFPAMLANAARTFNATVAATNAAVGAANNAASLVGTSTTTFTPSAPHSQTVTTQSGKAWVVGARLVLASAANPTTNFASGAITAYSGTSLTVSFDTIGSAPLSAADWNIALTGVTGSTGSTGATGVIGKAGFKYVLNTGTSGDPGTGKFRFNNATFMSATIVAFNETDGDSNALATLFDALDNGIGTNKIFVTAIKSDGSAFFSFFVTSTLTDQGAYDEWSISPQSTHGTITNGDTYYVLFVPIDKGDVGATGSTGSAGTNGTNGLNAGNKYTFNTATSGDPGSGQFLVNNATLASATQVNISETDGDGNGIAAYIATLGTSTSSDKAIFIFKTTDGTKGIIGKITSTLTDAGAYDTFTWSPITSWGSPANGNVLYFAAYRVGDKGATGSSGSGSGNFNGPGSSVAHNLVGFGDTGGQLGEDSGIATNQVVTLGGTQTLTSKTLTSPIIATISNSGTVTLPAGPDTLVGRATADTMTNKTLTAPKFADGGLIADNNGNEQIVFHTTASAVNQVGHTNAATGTNPKIAAEGDDTNIGLDLQAKGTGPIRLVATATAQSALQFFEQTGNGTNKITVSPAAAITADQTLTLPEATDTLVGRATTDTLTNKRIQERNPAVTASATPSINTDVIDLASITGLTTNITSMSSSLTGTPVHGQKLIIEITGTASRTISWGSSFEASTVSLPTTTSGTSMLTVGFKYNSATSKFRCLAVA